jgi:hypothetical protein
MKVQLWARVMRSNAVLLGTCWGVLTHSKLVEYGGNIMGTSWECQKSHEFNALEFDGNFMGTSKSQKFKPIFPSQKGG